MFKASPISISISRQVGSGGSTIGRRLAEKLSFTFMDREIVIEAAKKLGVSYEEVASCDEKASSLWKSFLYSCQYGDYSYVPAEHIPSDWEIHDAEAEIVLKAAREKPIIVVGRGGNFVLRDEPSHVSIFLYAGMDFRIRRVCQIFSVMERDAVKAIQETDHAREQYIQKFHRESVYDLRNYDLAINTGVFGLEASEELIMAYLRSRFGSQIHV